MPVRPHPITYECPACGWSKTVAPQSDCLIAGRDCFDACPECGNENLNTRPPKLIERLLSGVFDRTPTGR
ncbi:MAG: hypothetical protein LBP58_02325 [Azoarcus sp.]|nr:hypothetical protein [Azoarcus sp.]